MKSVKVERSFDGGRTWKRVSLGRSGGGYRFKVANPGAAGFVSLRVTATATTGTSLSQTVLNAYKIG